MRAYLVTGNPGSGKSAACGELSRRGLITVDTDDLAFWEDSAGLQVEPPRAPDVDWLRVHRWVWSRSRIEQSIAAAGDGAGCMFFCGIAWNQSDLLGLFQGVFLLVIDEETQNARLEHPSDSASPGRTEAVKQQIREGRVAFQAQMLARGAIRWMGPRRRWLSRTTSWLTSALLLTPELPEPAACPPRMTSMARRSDR